ncbi:hypothetical protein F4703DRAFT_1268465 [Phycomyces blakesleeanus]
MYIFFSFRIFILICVFFLYIKYHFFSLSNMMHRNELVRIGLVESLIWWRALFFFFYRGVVRQNIKMLIIIIIKGIGFNFVSFFLSLLLKKPFFSFSLFQA